MEEHMTRRRPRIVAALAVAVALGGTGLAVTDATADTYHGVANRSRSERPILIETHITNPRICTTGSPSIPQKCTPKPGYYTFAVKPGQLTSGRHPNLNLPGTPHRVYLPRNCAKRWASSPGQPLAPGWNDLKPVSTGLAFQVWNCG